MHNMKYCWKDLGGLKVHSCRHITNTQWTDNVTSSLKMITAEKFSQIWSVNVEGEGGNSYIIV